MDYRELLENYYNLAVEHNMVRNKTEFAQLLDTAIGTLSNSLNGVQKYASTCKTLCTRAEAEFARRGMNIHAGGDVAGGDMQKNFDNVSNPDMKDIVNTLVAEIAAQRSQLMQEMKEQRENFMEILRMRQ